MKNCFCSPQIFYLILRWNAVKLCNFNAIVSSEFTKSHHISWPLQGFEPLASCMSCTSSTAPSLTNFQYFCFEFRSNSLYFLWNQRDEFLWFAIFSGDITYFSGDMWWLFVSTPRTLVVKLHKFTAWKSVKKM